MEKIDYKTKLKHLYKPSVKKVDIVEVPQLNYLMIDGEGNPNTSRSFQDAIDVLYPLSLFERKSSHFQFHARPIMV